MYKNGSCRGEMTVHYEFKRFFQYAHRIVLTSLWIISTGLYLSFNLHNKFLLGDNYPVTYKFPHSK